MKIINISFTNINNLKGEHSVDFDKAPLSSAGIFAIVGPTGSGKSTLLDVITLALFNRIPRFKTAISKNNIGDMGSVMTNHTDEAKASITFEIKGMRYTSTWGISRARTGKLRDYEMFLYDSGGTPMDLKKSEVPSRNEELIGLKYDQFIKSIILSQGEFAKFLKADKNERGQLLENITGTSIYRRLSIAAYNKHKATKEVLEKEKEVLGVIQVLTGVERMELESNLKESKKLTSKFEEDVKVLADLKKVKEELTKITKELEDKKIESTAVKQQISNYQPQLQKLSLHDKISPLREDIRDYQTAERNAKMSQTNLNDYKSTLESSSKNLQQVIVDMSTICKQKVNADNFKSTMSKFEKQVNDLDRDLYNTKEKGKIQRQDINEKKTSYPIHISDESSPTDAITFLKSRGTELIEILKNNNLDDQSDLAHIRELMRSTQAESSALKDIAHHYEHLGKQEASLKEQRNKLVLCTKELKNKIPLLKAAEETLKALKTNLELFLKSKEDAIKIANLEQLRSDLTDGEPCPLCGSTDHPYTLHLPNSSASEIDQKITTSKRDGQKKEEEVNSMKRSIIELTSSTESIKNRIEEIKKNLDQEQNILDSSIKIYSGKEKINHKNVSELYNTKVQSHNNLVAAVKALDESKLNNELLAAYNRLNAIGVEYKILKEQRNELYQGRDVSAECNGLQDRFTRANTSIEKSKTAIDKETKDLEGANKILQSLGSKLQPQIESLGFSTLTEIQNGILDEHQVQKIKSDQEQLLKFQTTNETVVKTLRVTLKSLKNKDTQPETSLENLSEELSKKEQKRQQHNTAIGEKQSQLKRDDEDKAKIKVKEKELSKLQKELEKWSLLNHMIGSAKGDKFANFSQGLTLQNLIVYTNKRLTSLSDRYLVDRPTEDGALMVIDQYQGNIQRAVTTLSGGETFLISLALALSLSDMASKNVALDCLFIDEGFGTLDHDTLDTAMNTLEKLQSESQKTVGVISHIEALKERINVQIKLEKNAQGYSEIKVEG